MSTEAIDVGDALLDFQQAVIDLCAEYADLPILGIIGALHGAAHVLTSAAFDPSEDELGEEFDEDFDEEGEGDETDGPLAVSYAVDEPEGD